LQRRQSDYGLSRLDSLDGGRYRSLAVSEFSVTGVSSDSAHNRHDVVFVKTAGKKASQGQTQFMPRPLMPELTGVGDGGDHGREHGQPFGVYLARLAFPDP